MPKQPAGLPTTDTEANTQALIGQVSDAALDDM